MRRITLSLSAIPVGLLFFIGACFSETQVEPEPEPEFSAAVAIAAVSLAEECGAPEARAPSADCAEPAPQPDMPEGGAGAAPPGGAFAPCAPGGCCGFPCQQSSVTLSIQGDGDRSGTFRVVRGALLTAEGQELVDLTVTDPRVWTDEGYVAWDEVIGTPSDLRVMYDLRDLDWSAALSRIEGGSIWSTTYRVRLVVEVDGVERVVTSEETTREAPVVT